jgi:hypothetical protein
MQTVTLQTRTRGLSEHPVAQVFPLKLRKDNAWMMHGSRSGRRSLRQSQTFGVKDFRFRATGGLLQQPF